MPQDARPPLRDLRDAMAGVVGFLLERWPDAADVAPSDLPGDVSDELFLEAALALQDEGSIMYEAMLVGTRARPALRSAILTRKGQLQASTPAQ